MGVSLRNARACLPPIVVAVALGCHPGQGSRQAGGEGSGDSHGDEARRHPWPQIGDETRTGSEGSDEAGADANEEGGAVPGAVEAAARDTDAAEGSGGSSTAGSSESVEMGAEVAADGQADGGAGADVGAGASSDPDSAMTPLAVDAGNPKDVGPSPKPGAGPRLRFHLADAAIADLASAFYLRPIAIEIVNEVSVLERLPLAVGAIDLLLYRGGNKLLVFDDHVMAANALTKIRLVLDALEPATIAFADAPPSPVAIPIAGDPALTQDVAIAIKGDVTTDMTLHIDLRKNLRDDGAGGHVLLPTMDAFESHTRGALQAIGIDATAAAVGCVYRELESNLRVSSLSDLPAAPTSSLETVLDPILDPVQGTVVEPLAQVATLSLQSGDSRCWDAAGSSVIGSDGFRVDYLVPGRYRIRLFLTDTLYVELPMLADVTADVVSLVDLSEVGAMIPAH